MRLSLAAIAGCLTLAACVNANDTPVNTRPTPVTAQDRGVIQSAIIDGMKDLDNSTARDLHWPERLTLLGAFLACGFTWWIINRLRRILLSVNQGDAFEFANVKRLQAVGLGLIGLQLVNLALVVAATLGEGALNRSLNLGAWLGILVVFILAEVFRQGAAMRDEQLTTV